MTKLQSIGVILINNDIQNIDGLKEAFQNKNDLKSLGLVLF